MVSQKPKAGGVRRRPVVFVIVATLLMGLAGFLGWVAYLSELEPIAAGGVVFLGVLAALLTFKASSLIFVVSPLFFSGASVLLITGHASGEMVSAWFAAAALTGAAHLVFAVRPCWSVLVNPKLRWWRSRIRVPLELKARVCPVVGGEFYTLTCDISETGAFLSLEDARVCAPRHTGVSTRNQVDPVSELKPGAHCSIRFELNQYTAFTCSARIIRREDSPKGAYRAGFGVLFVGLSAGQRRKLARYLKGMLEERAAAGKYSPQVAASVA